jgi:CRP-like cAMP-binding protein
MIDRLLAYMSLFTPLGSRERQSLTRAADVTLRSFRSREELLRPGDRPEAIQLIFTGIGCRYSILPNGRRQITSLLLPGDTVGFDSLLGWPACDTVTALTTMQCLQIPARLAASWIEGDMPLGQVLWRIRELQTARCREWMINIGTRPALQRLAHFFCETMLRSRALGMGTGLRCALPMTQIELADVAAVTPVHLNRILMELRRGALARFKRGLLEIPDLGLLRAFTDFDPRYLLPLRDAGPATGTAASSFPPPPPDGSTLAANLL